MIYKYQKGLSQYRAIFPLLKKSRFLITENQEKQSNKEEYVCNDLILD